MRKHSRGVQLISLDFINFPWITKTGVSNFELVIRQKISEKNLYCADGRTDGRTEIKSVLRFSLYFVRIQIMYISTYMCHQNLSPTFLLVSKFYVKLGVVVKTFKITAGS